MNSKMNRLRVVGGASVATLAASALVPTTALAASTSGADLLIPKPAEFIPALVAFVIIWVIMAKVAWPSVLGIDKDWERTNREKWRALEQLYLDGRIRAIGVSNFLPHHLLPLLEQATVSPLVNQLEIHPGYPQTDTVSAVSLYDPIWMRPALYATTSLPPYSSMMMSAAATSSA